MERSTPLEGIRIIDFTHVLQGPLATQLLADFGADVIKIERAGLGDWSRGYGPYAGKMSLVFAGLNRNKRSAVIDVNSSVGKQIALKLIAGADVLVHNFRPGVIEKLGLDYATLSPTHPRLIFAHSSGWGDQGPDVDRRRKGHADMAAATGGLFKSDEEGGIPRPPGMTVDYPAGLLLVQAILLALLERVHSGKGQQVSTDLLSTAVMASQWYGGEELNPELAEHPEQDLASTDASIPRAWRTQDGFIEISAVFSPDALRDISLAMGLEDFSQDPRFKAAQARLANKTELVEILAKRFLEKTTLQWFDILEKNNVLCSKINTFAEALKEPQLLANQMIVEVERPGIGNLRLLGSPIRMSRTPSRVGDPPPYLGEQTDEVLREIGYTESEIKQFYELGVIESSTL